MPTTFLQRLGKEKAALDRDIALNGSFIDTNPVFGTLSPRARILQKRQLDVQRVLSFILGERIVELTPKG